MEYLRGLRELCDRHEWLLMLDEVQCGLGRTGKWFVYQHAGILPDVVPLAKGLGSGVPVGACVAGGRAAGVFKPGNHGSTFGGNPLACTAVVATIDAMREERLLENAARVGQLIRDELAAALAGVAGVVEIRGMGLMIGVRARSPLRRVGARRARRRAGDQRYGRQRGAHAAAAGDERSRGTRGRRAPSPPDQGFPLARGRPAPVRCGALSASP